MIHAAPCTLRPWRPDDLASLVRYANNRRVWLHLRDRLPYPYTEADGISWIEHATTVQPLTNFAIEYQCEAIGSIGLTPGCHSLRVFTLAMPEASSSGGVLTYSLDRFQDLGQDRLLPREPTAAEARQSS